MPINVSYIVLCWLEISMPTHGEWKVIATVVVVKREIPENTIGLLQVV